MSANILRCVNWRIVSMRQATNYRGIVVESPRATHVSPFVARSKSRFAAAIVPRSLDCVSAGGAGNCSEIEAKKRDNGRAHRSRSLTSSCRLATEHADDETPRKITLKATVVKREPTFIRRKELPEIVPRAEQIAVFTLETFPSTL